MRSVIISVLLTAGASGAFARQGVIKGTVRNDQGQPVPFVNVSIPQLKKGTVANASGVFILSAPQGEHTIRISGVGQKSLEQAAQFSKDTTITDLTLQSSGDLNEVVVSASRRKETLDEVPSSITIVGPRELETQKGISNNIMDILAATVPGLGFSGNQTGNTGQTLRGRNLLVMVDGIPQSTPLRAGGRDMRTIDPSAIERVEVIKGATSIYGNGSDGGLINYITKKGEPGKPLSGKTTVGVTTQLKNAQHTGGLQLGQLLSGAAGKFDFVVSGHYEQTGVYKDAKGGIISPEYGLGETQLWNGFAKIGYTINPKNRVEVMYNFFGSQQKSDYVLKTGRYLDTPSIGVPGVRKGSPEGTPFNHNASVHWSSQGIVGGTDLDVNGYIQRFRTIYSFVDSWKGGGQSQINSKKSGLRINLSSPVRAGKNIDIQAVYGLDFMNDITNQDLVDGRVWVPEMDMRNYAPYAQLKTTFLRHWVLKAGARFENINIDVPDFTTIVSKNNSTGEYNVGGVPVKGGSLSYNALVYNAGLRYNEWTFFKPFVSYSQSFSIADLGRTLRSAKENTLSLLKTKAVIAHNYEVGASSTLGPVNLEASYYISRSALGSAYTEVDGRFEIERNPEKVYGFEFAADARILKNLSAGGSYSFVEGKIDKDGNGKYKDEKDAWIGGDRISPQKVTAYVKYSPLESWSLRLQMLQALERDRFKPGANGKYAYAQGPVNGFAIFSLYSNLQLDSHSGLSLGVDNLFNKDYYTVTSQWNARNENYIKGNGVRLNLQYTYDF
ncbi:TonB-dependent receptor [Chitinophaga rhizosphaerae]|uniref:TonB-dependent receptor n=1 Tax=Chitinophaga rhizosphaerae TaxID=1864947 RepID=UPI0013DEBF33|nr:TonB-dependent receptor [Chitinophaga rhizosphaerae]